MLATLLAAVALGLGEQLAVAAGDSEVDTQFIFGFTQGEDVGEVGRAGDRAPNNWSSR